jgi:hypothetical protein
MPLQWAQAITAALIMLEYVWDYKGAQWITPICGWKLCSDGVPSHTTPGLMGGRAETTRTKNMKNGIKLYKIEQNGTTMWQHLTWDTVITAITMWTQDFQNRLVVTRLWKTEWNQELPMAEDPFPNGSWF